MINIGRASAYQCREPVLVIVGRPEAKHVDPPIRLYVCPRGQAARELVLDP
jgi:hypothetical protein